VIGEPDAGKPHVRFDEGVQETCDIATRLRPTLQSPQLRELPSYLLFPLKQLQIDAVIGVPNSFRGRIVPAATSSEYGVARDLSCHTCQGVRPPSEP
jgi:hypothetical protein